MKYTIPGTNAVIDGKPFEGFEAVVSPAMAKILLKHANPDNRKMSMASVNKYRSDMENGKWQSMTNIISFWDDGTLADGHHRLTALASCSKPILMRFVTIPRKNASLFDTGKTRTAFDITGIRTHVSAGIRLFLAIVGSEQDTTVSARNEHKIITISDIADFYSQNEYRIQQLYENVTGSSPTGAFFDACLSAYMCGVSLETLKNFKEAYFSTVSVNVEEASVKYASATIEKMNVRGVDGMITACKVFQTAIYNYDHGFIRKKVYKPSTCEGCYTGALRPKYIAMKGKTK